MSVQQQLDRVGRSRREGSRRWNAKTFGLQVISTSLMSAGGAGSWPENLSLGYRYQRTRDWLDVGCGTGALTEVILETATPHAVRGVDASAGFIEYAKARIANPLASFEVGDAQSLPVDSAIFDVAVAALVLNFVPKHSAAVAEMTRAVRPGGVVAVYVWDYAGKMELMRYFGMRLWRSIRRLLISTRGGGFDLRAEATFRTVRTGGTTRGGSTSDRCSHAVSRFR